MTKEELNRRCAEHEGWEFLKEPVVVVNFCPWGEDWEYIGYTPDGEGFEDIEDACIPDYTTDFNAAQRIIDMASEKDAVALADKLLELDDVCDIYHSGNTHRRLEAALEVLDEVKR